MNRKCGNCTKCCEGYLNGKVKDKSFYEGKPCHFVAIGKGCSIYKDRPLDPCITYRCAWLTDENLPEWFKPNAINAIVDFRKIKHIKYINVVEAGETLKVEVLSWLILYALNNGLNLHWTINGGPNYLGSQEFLDEMNSQVNNK